MNTVEDMYVVVINLPKVRHLDLLDAVKGAGWYNLQNWAQWANDVNDPNMIQNDRYENINVVMEVLEEVYPDNITPIKTWIANHLDYVPKVRFDFTRLSDQDSLAFNLLLYLKPKDAVIFNLSM